MQRLWLLGGILDDTRMKFRQFIAYSSSAILIHFPRLIINQYMFVDDRPDHDELTVP